MGVKFATGHPSMKFTHSPLSAYSFLTYLVLVLVLPIFAIAPLFYPGDIQTHAGLVPVWNVADLRANLTHWGWLPHLATAFDPLRSDGLLPYYLAALLPLAPASAVKAVIGLSWLLGGLGMFLWLQSWLGRPGALIAALVYIYLPYQIVTVYVRGAWGESLFLGLLPWAILAATYLVTSPRLRFVPVAGLFWLALGLSQLGLTGWALLFLGLLLVVVHPRQALLPLAGALLGSSGAAALTLFRASISSPPVDFTAHLLYPAQLFSAYWGFGVSRVDWNDGLSLQLGLAALGLSVVAVVLWQRSQTVDHADRRLLFFSAATVGLVGLQVGPAALLWNLPGLGSALSAMLTYPWQLLGLTGLALAVLAGAALWLDEQLTTLPLFAALVLLVLLSSFQYLLPQFSAGQDYDGGPQAVLGERQLAVLAHDFSVVTSGHTAGLTVGDTAIPLTVAGPLRPTDTLQLNIVWQPLRPFVDNLKMFVHLVDSNSNILAQFDGQPQGGELPTAQWIPGAFIRDSYALRLPAELPPGPYRVFVGLYDEATFARLAVPGDPEGRVIFDVE